MALRTLRIGMIGLDVEAVQQALNTREGGIQPNLLPGTLRFHGDENAPIQSSTTKFTSPGLSPGILRFPGMLPPGWYDDVYTGLGALNFRPLSLPLLRSPRSTDRCAVDGDSGQWRSLDVQSVRTTDRC